MPKTCPNCGAGWDQVSEAAGQLSDAGYIHRDVTHVCGVCGDTWLHGHPEGQTVNPDLRCDVCDHVMLPHKWDGASAPIEAMHLKCPECFYFRRGLSLLELDNGEVAVGHPAITGEVEAGE
jgi:hypothetical protein